MKVTYNWLKDFVEIKISAEALADKLTMAGLEVTSLERRAGDFVFEIEVTSNRPDCLSIVGIAREVAAITNCKPKTSCVKDSKRTTQDAQQISIKIENIKDCPLYTATIIKDVRVGPSPQWLKERLELVGCRSVNNIVDITNYILFTWGQPTHAFDLDKLSQDLLMVRRAKKEERIITIDAQERILNPDTLVIADKNKAVAMAGVMGGLDTEVSENTKNILLEAAIFNPIIVRRVRQNLGLQTESSYRFERGIDLETHKTASLQAAHLIERVSGGRCILTKSSGVVKPKKIKINLGLTVVKKILGINIALPKIKNILNKLGFKVKLKAKNNLSVEVPLYRSDVIQEIDLIEEIARIFGYEKIPQNLPRFSPQITTSGTKSLISAIKNILVSLGLNEVITYSLIRRDLLKALNSERLNPIEILNPLSKEQEILRPTIIPSLTGCVAYNLNQRQDYINIFEVTKVFSKLNGKLQEEQTLGIALCGIKSFFVFEQGLLKDQISLLHLKGILETLFMRLGIQDYHFNRLDAASYVDVYIGKEKIGLMTTLEKGLLDYLNIKNKDVFVAELCLDKIFSYANLKKQFASLPIYPGISRDISIVIKDEIKIEDILIAVRKTGQPLLWEAKIADYYKGKQIPQGFKGLTVSCLYRSDERTLTEIEINPVHSLILSMLTERFGAQIR